MEHKTILITGGLGYIGSHLAYALLQKGYKVIIVDNKINNYVDEVKGAQTYIFDCRNAKLLKDIFDYYKIDYVIHLASLKSIKESEENPALYYDYNIACLTSLLRASNCKNITFASSASVYGDPTEKCKITDKLNPKNVYAKTKVICEEILKDIYTHNKEYNINILRYFNPIGYQFKGVQKGNNLLDIICQVATKQRKYLVLYNNGNDIRDYIYIGDLINATILNLSNKGLHIKNIGTSIGASVNDILNLFTVPIPTIDGGERSCDVPFLVSCDSCATTKNLKDIITEVIDICV